jgi:L-ascorbate metabolism protein UlaG (beta-lactamase superfamily)
VFASPVRHDTAMQDEAVAGDLSGTVPSARITFLGHSTVLIEVDELRILTDPMLAQWLGPIRRHHAPVPDELFADIDAIFVSHAHQDHLHVPSLRRVPGKPTLLVPRGLAPVVRSVGLPVVEVGIGEALTIDRVSVEITYAEHAGRRLPFGPDAVAIGCVIRGSRNVYFAGDTDVFDGMASFGELDVALLPVWGWGPRLGPGHMNPTRAAQAAAIIRPRIAVPIHWGTLYPLGAKQIDPGPLNEPGAAFAEACRWRAPGVDVRVIPVGGTLELPADGGHAGMHR